MTRLLVVLEVVLLLVLCCWRTFSLDQTCSESVQLCYTTLEYPDHFAINNNALLVGLRNEIIQFSLDLEVLQNVYSFDAGMNASCHSDSRNKVTDCHNYHRSIIFPSGNQIIAGDTTADQTFIACGTNFLQPSCQYRLKSNLSLVKNQDSNGFCPEQADTDTAFVEFNTTLWVGTVLNDVTNGALTQSQQPFNGEVVHATVFNSAFWLKTSSFVDMYERGDYVYAFFREITVELNPNAVRSRVARICKSDAGGRQLSHITTYLTYVKSTIRCAVQGVASGEKRYQKVSFYFDNLHDTTLLQSGSYSQSSRRPTQVYGVFQNSGNGPVGSVVCVYTLDHMSNDVTRVFNGDYLSRVSSTTTWQRADNDNPFTCDTGRSVQDAENNIIMYSDVEQANPASYPLYLKNGQRFHKIAVGQVRGLDDVMYEVMFIAAENEEGNYFITKVSYVVGRGEQRSVEHDVLMLNQSDRRINHMHYHEHDDDGEDMLYISTPNRLYRMNPFYCAAHLTCTVCVASMDPYCVYDTIQGACVGINSANRNAALQNVTGGVASCPVVTASPTMPTTTTDSDHLNISSTSTITNVLLPTSDPPPTANSALQSSSSESDGMWGWFGIGAGVGTCVGLVIGVFFMFAWQRRLGFLAYCSDDHVDGGPCGGEASGKGGAYGSDDTYGDYEKKSAANVENGIPCYAKGNNDYSHSMAHGKNEYYSPPVKGNNNYNVDTDPPKQLAKCDQSNVGKCNQSLHERRTSQPVKMLKMHESPQRLRSHSLQHGPPGVVHAPVHVPVSFTSQAVPNIDMARYGSNYSLDPDTSKPTLTPTNKNRVYFNTDRDSIDLDQTPYKSTDC